MILEFLKNQIHAVISTSNSSNNPEAALIGFGQTDNLEIIFGTAKKTRKYKNIKYNSQVALVIGGWKEDITVQYEGEAFELTSDVETYKKQYFSKVPSAKKYENYPNQTYFRVIPKWIRYSDLSGDVEQIFEIRS